MGREGEEGSADSPSSSASPPSSSSSSSSTTTASPPSSAIPRFFEKTRDERLGAISGAAGLGAGDAETLRDASGGLAFEQADNMVENAIGTFATPLGVATNFVVNGRDVLVPMVIEEPSVIAAASKGAKAARGGGGFRAAASDAYSIGQIQLLDVADADAAARSISERSKDIIALANTKSPTLSRMGRGAKEVSCRTVDAPSGRMLVAELLIDVGDAMGANVTNSMCEAVAPLLEDVCGGGARALLRILSNYSTRRTVRAQATFPQGVVGGPGVVGDMISAFEFADCDVYRAVTHNKGVMNGIIAVANATGQDGRAIEAAAHAYACRTGRYRSITQWGRNDSGDLVGTIELPMSVGVVGGVVNIHPVARACMRILGAGSAGELACIMASAGLAQNYAAMRALATDGIQKGHMRLHARNLAVAAGAGPDEVDGVVRRMVSEGTVSPQGARDALDAERQTPE